MDYFQDQTLLNVGKEKASLLRESLLWKLRIKIFWIIFFHRGKQQQPWMTLSLLRCSKWFVFSPDFLRLAFTYSGENSFLIRVISCACIGTCVEHISHGRDGLPKKSSCSFGFCPNEVGGGPAQNFCPLFTNCIYWVNLGMGRERETHAQFIFLAHWRS